MCSLANNIANTKEIQQNRLNSGLLIRRFLCISRIVYPKMKTQYTYLVSIVRKTNKIRPNIRFKTRELASQVAPIFKNLSLRGSKMVLFIKKCVTNLRRQHDPEYLYYMIHDGDLRFY